MDETSSPGAAQNPASPPPPPPASSSRLPSFLNGRNGVIAAVVAVVLLAVVALTVFKKESHTITGSITLSAFLGDTSIALDDYQNPAKGDECSGLGGYDDMDAGTEVTVKDEDGTLLATGSLQEGKLSDFSEDGAFFLCKFSFVIEDVPDAKFYSIETGTRGEISFSKEEMEKQDWEVGLSLGSS